MSDPLRLQEAEGSVSFDILVSPRASRPRLGPVSDGRLKVAISAPPVEGKANAAVVQLLARALGVRRAQVSLVSGEKSKRKTVRVEGLDAAELLSALERAAGGSP